MDEVYEKTFTDYEKFEDVNDQDFEFGFGMEKSKEHKLNKISTSVSVVNNSANGNNRPAMEEPNYEEGEINLGNVALEEHNESLQNVEMEEHEGEEEEQEEKPVSVNVNEVKGGLKIKKKRSTTSKKVKV